MTQILIPRAQNDSAWKTVLDAYFPEFIAFFYPTIAAAIDWQAGYDPLDKELQAITSDSMVGKRAVDKLFRVQLQEGGERWLFLHVEIQSSKEQEFSSRLFEYYYRLHDRYRKPIMTLAVLADDNPHWRPQTYQAQVLGVEVFTFRFLTSKLLDYKDKIPDLEKDNNPFGIVVVAHLLAMQTRKNPNLRFDYKFSLTKQLYERGLQRDAILTLYSFIDWVMTLPNELEIRYNEDIQKLEEQRAVAYITSAGRIGMQKGLEQGIQQGMQQGMQQGRLELAKALWQQGMPLETISKAMKISVNELQALLAEKNSQH